MPKFYKPRKREQCFDKFGDYKPLKNRLPRKFKKLVKKIDKVEDLKFKSKFFKRIPIYEILLNRCRAYNYRF